MKVIFLDIDGVMITGSHQKISASYDGYEFTPYCVENLKYIMKITGAKIVVSSTWRQMGFDRLQKMFEANGIEQGLVGQTPILPYGLRGDEIQQYLEESKLDPAHIVEKFVILDDHQQVGHLYPFLILTEWFTGLDQDATEKTIKMLI